VKPCVYWREWIHHFTDLIRNPSKGFASPQDPLDLGQPETCYVDPAITPSRIPIHSFDDTYTREACLTAFLSWWLSYFVLPSQELGKIRPSTFVMANLMARGQRVSLAVPTLANVYKTLRSLCTSSDPSFSKVVIPWHFVSAWLHMHWVGLYLPVLPESLRMALPIMADIAGAMPKQFRPNEARTCFNNVEKHFRKRNECISPRTFTYHKERQVDRILLDSFCDLIDPNERLNFEFLVSVRYGLLPLRIGNSVVLEPYSPHRCAHQFRLDQGLPEAISFPSSVSASLEDAGKCWVSLLRRGVKSYFFIPAISREFYFSAIFRRWYDNLINPLRPLPPNFAESMTSNNATSSATVKRKLASQVTPPDFRGRDSSYIQSRVLQKPHLSRMDAGTSLSSFVSPFLFYILIVIMYFIQSLWWTQHLKLYLYIKLPLLNQPFP